MKTVIHFGADRAARNKFASHQSWLGVARYGWQTCLLNSKQSASSLRQKLRFKLELRDPKRLGAFLKYDGTPLLW
jgi:hypothetical protein